METLKRAPALLDAPRQDRLKMGRLFLARHDADLDFSETRPLQPPVQIAFGKSEPAIAVEFARPLETVLEQIENHDRSGGRENLVRRSNRSGRHGRVAQRLAQNHQINTLWFDGRMLQASQAKLEVLQPVFLRFRRAERDNPFRVI